MSERSVGRRQRRSALRNPEATREAILSAAISEIDTVGESGLRVASVARAAGVTTGAIYNLFEDRDQLITAAYAQLMLTMAERAHESQRDLEENFTGNRILSPGYRTIMEALFSHPNQEQRLRWAAIAARAQHDPQLAELISPIERQAADGVLAEIRYSQEQGWLRDDVDARAVVALMFGATFGVSVAARAYRDVPDFDTKLVDAWLYLAQAFVPESQD